MLETNANARLMEETAVKAPRVGVAFPGNPFDARTWSGTPAGLSRGLRAAGVSVVPLNAEPAPRVDFFAKNLVAMTYLRRAWRGFDRETIRFARAIARASPELGWVQGQALRRRLRAAGPLDGAIRIGTGYTMNAGVPTAVFDDLTVVQAVELGYVEWRALPRRAVKKRIDRQRRIYEQADAVCVTSHWARDSVTRDYGIAPERVAVVGVGRNYEVRVTHRDWSAPRFLFVGTNWYGKNGDAVVRAFTRLRRRIPTAGLDLVGDHPQLSIDGVTCHGTLRPDLLGHRARMEALFRAATCFVLPSRYEAAAIAYVEAGAAGLPCIGTLVGGAGELIGPAGLLVDPGDEEALFDAMEQLADPDRARRLGQVALERAHLFTWEVVAERVLRSLRLPGIDLEALAPPL